MNKKLASALLIGTTISSLLFSTAPAFASQPCQTLSPGNTVECVNTSNSLKILKGGAVTAPTTEAYPAPSVTPNTVNGAVPESSKPTPAPAAEAQEPAKLANTGVGALMYVWAGIGALALAIGIATVVRVRRRAKA